MINLDELTAFFQVMFIDLVLAGDNAIVVGMVAANVPLRFRSRVIALGIVLATVVRIAFSFVALNLLKIIGLMLAGGILLLWVGWKLWREILASRGGQGDVSSSKDSDGEGMTFGSAIFHIVLADVSMSLDNVLAVAGAARHHTVVLVLGLVVSISLMAMASAIIARLLHRFHWIAYIGLLVIMYVAGSMIWEGAHQVYGALG